MFNFTIEKIIGLAKQYKLFIIIPFLLVFAFALIEEITKAIEICFVPITMLFISYWPFDVLFAIIGFVLFLYSYSLFKPHRRIVPNIQFAVSVILLAIYLYYRITDKDFNLSEFQVGAIKYLDVFALFLLIIIIAWLIDFVKSIQQDNTEKVQSEVNQFSSDSPIENDEQDVFGMADKIECMVDFIKLIDASEHSFSLGLSGKWGSGKTSMFNMIKSVISKKKYDWIIVEFNPRTSKKAEYIQDDYLRTLKSKLRPYHSGLDKYFYEYAAALNLPTDTPILGFLTWLFSARAKNWQESYDSIDSIIETIGRKIIVLIDDLDRLTGEEIVETMKIIGTNASFKNIVYITSYDKKYVNTVLSGYLSCDENIVFTDKYINAEIDVPVHTFAKLVDYLKKLLKNSSQTELIRVSEKDIESIVDNCSGVIKPRLTSLRDIKRFYNQFIFDYSYIQNEVIMYEYLLLSLIKYSSKEEFENLHRLMYVAQGSKENGVDSKIWFLKDMQETKEPKCMDILLRLFPDQGSVNKWYKNMNKRISNASSFETYFYNFEYNHLYTKDFNSLYDNYNLRQACDKIDSWEDRVKDIENFLANEEYLNWGNKDKLSHYFSILIYSFVTYSGINKLNAYAFVREVDTKQIKQKYGFSDESYIDWMKATMLQLMGIKMNIPISYIVTLISSINDDASNENVFLPLNQLQVVAYGILEDYLNKIDADEWDAVKAFELHVAAGNGQQSIIDEKTANILKQSMISRPEKYIESLMPKVYVENDVKVMRFIRPFEVYDVFETDRDFEKVINSLKVANFKYIEVIKKWWRLLLNNDYNPLWPDANVEDNISSISSWIDKQQHIIDEIEDIQTNVGVIAKKWDNNKRYILADGEMNKLNELKKSLNQVSLNIAFKEHTILEIDKVIKKIREDKIQALKLSAKDLRPGDIVSLEFDLSDQNPNQYSLKKILSIRDGVWINLQGYQEEVHIFHISAVPIDGVKDKNIYFDSAFASNFNLPGELSDNDRTYYIETLKKFETNGVSCYDSLIKARNPQFVHEVQHWLRDVYGNDYLKID